MFSKVIAPAIGSLGFGVTGSRAGNIASSVVTRSVDSAGALAGNVKSKDEVTLDVILKQTGGSSTMAKVYKAKAKSDDEYIILGVTEQAAQAIVTSIGK